MYEVEPPRPSMRESHRERDFRSAKRLAAMIARRRKQRVAPVAAPPSVAYWADLAGFVLLAIIGLLLIPR